MISMDDLNAEIQTLESEEPSYTVMDRLSALYIIRDEMRKNGQTKSVKLSGSEFLMACSDVDMTSLFSILDEHMDAVKLIHPKEYMVLIQKIKALHNL